MTDNQPFSAEIVENLTVTQLDEWAAFYAREESETENIWASAEWLLFSVADERFILPMSALDEISVVTRGVGLPHLPPAVIGVMNLRGETILTVDLGQMLGLRGGVSHNNKQRVLLFKESGDGDQQRTAFLIDEILAVTDFDENSLQSLHERAESERARYMDAVADSREGRSISRLRVDALLRGVREML